MRMMLSSRGKRGTDIPRDEMRTANGSFPTRVVWFPICPLIVFVCDRDVWNIALLLFWPFGGLPFDKRLLSTAST
jgi:hypothetical protein